MASAVSPASLLAAFGALPDPRRIASIVYPVPALLALTVAAMLGHCLSVLAIAAWGADQDPALLAALGFPSAKTPCQSTPQRLFAKLDGDALGATLTGDALFCQRDLCDRGCAAGGDYLLTLKANQGQCYTEVALFFDPPTAQPA